MWYNIEDVGAQPLHVRLERTMTAMSAMKYDFSHMGENIAALRRAAGLTQELLAERLGVTSQAVS